jgi:hypothetical protein
MHAQTAMDATTSTFVILAEYRVMYRLLGGKKIVSEEKANSKHSNVDKRVEIIKHHHQRIGKHVKQSLQIIQKMTV